MTPLLPALVGCGGPHTPTVEPHSTTTGLTPPLATVSHAALPEQLLARRFEVTLTPAADAVLGCTDGAGEDHVLGVDGGGALELWGLLADTPYDCELRWPDEDGTVLWSGAFVTDPLPEGLPTLELSVDSGPSLLDTSYVLVAWWRWNHGVNVVSLLVLDGEGRIRWLRTMSEATKVGVAADWLGDVMLVGGGAAIPPTLVDLAGNVSAQAAPPVVPEEGWHHEVKRTPEGWLLGMQAVPLAGDVFGFRVDVTDPRTGELPWSFDSAPFVLDGTLPAPEPGNDDPYHANAVSWVDDLWGPAVWISLRGVRRILRVDRATGEVTHQLGPDLGVRYVDLAGDPLPEADGFFVTHDPEIALDRLLVFDNGGGRPGGSETRITRYQLLGDDELAREWTWTEPGWFEPSFGSVQTLPDGTVLVGSGHEVNTAGTGGQSRRGFVMQLDGPAGRVIRRLDLPTPDDSIYRARFVDGCSLFANRRTCPERP